MTLRFFADRFQRDALFFRNSKRGPRGRSAPRFETQGRITPAPEDYSCIGMHNIKTNDLPPFKPWCRRVARTVTKKYGARENWPNEWRHAHTAERKAKRNARRDPTEEEMWLRAESKRGGIEAEIARMKLRAIKQRKIISAKDMRLELATRLERLHASRESGSKEGDLAPSPTQTNHKQKQ